MNDYVIWGSETWETRDLTRTCSMFFITPNNELFMMDTSGCYDYEMTGPEEPHYDHDHIWKNWNIIPNGTHGSVKPFFFTGRIDLTPQYVRDRPNTKRIHVVDGLIQG